MFTARTLRWLLLIIVSFWAKAVLADPDIAAQNYSAARSPGLDTCTSGYDLLAGDVQYGQRQIVGALPYVLIYKAPLRQNITEAQTFTDGWSSNSGWTDNYQNHIAIDNFTITREIYYEPGYSFYNEPMIDLLNPLFPPKQIIRKLKVLYVRLPGDSAETLFKEEVEGGVITFQRLYSADPVQELREKGAENLKWSNDLGEYAFNRNGSGLSIQKNGEIYSISSALYNTGNVTAESAEYAYLQFYGMPINQYVWMYTKKPNNNSICEC